MSNYKNPISPLRFVSERNRIGYGRNHNSNETASRYNKTRTLAKRLGVNPQSVTNWEEGRNCPNADTLIAVCRELGFELIVKERYTNGMYTTEPQEGKH